MEWTELMQFLLDNVNQRNQMTFDVKNIEKQKIGDDEIDDESCDDKIIGLAHRNYSNYDSKISGATDFSVVSDFSEVA